MIVREIMNREVKVVRAEQSIAEVARLFAESHIHGAPVVDAENRLLGIVTESDILGATKSKYIKYNLVYPSIHQFGLDFRENYSEIAKAFEEVKSTPVSEIMTRKVISVSPDDAVEEVASMMVRGKINRVPVVERGRVVGILTRGDILRGLFKNQK